MGGIQGFGRNSRDGAPNPPVLLQNSTTCLLIDVRSNDFGVIHEYGIQEAW